ncbi:MAG TPA: nitroreductase/quinone reductase family protein [Actinomycetota bacterium]|nr:nitroreductase/quinone reductase family protein [Actinomycetota bacterium]
MANAPGLLSSLAPQPTPDLKAVRWSWMSAPRERARCARERYREYLGEPRGRAVLLPHHARASDRPAPHHREIWFVLRGHTIYLLAGGGRRSNWVRNLMQAPDVGVRIGGRRFSGRGRLVDDPDEEGLVRDLLPAKYRPGYTATSPTGRDVPCRWRSTFCPGRCLTREQDRALVDGARPGPGPTLFIVRRGERHYRG